MTDLHFAYPTKPDVPIVRGVSVDVKRNHIVALVGASGCGKSSLICLVERWYDPDKGKICYNGEDLKNLDNRWYH
jgi:ABC-type multidrug transport system fused ATPase/permease subunit